MARDTVGIVGAGVVGLSCALKLCEAGYQVSVIARDLPGDDTTSWASPWAGAVVLPYVTDDVRDRSMQVASLRYYWALAHQDPTSGVQTVNVREYWDQPGHDNPTEWYAGVVPGFRKLGRAELPPGTLAGNAFVAISVNPDKFLMWLKNRLQNLHKVHFVKTEVKSLNEARRMLDCRFIVNASGLGAGILANDKEVVGVRGQTMLVDCPLDPMDSGRMLDKEVRIRRGNEYTYVLPRMLSGGVIIGGVEDEGNMSTRISADLQADILKRVNIMTDGWFKSLKLSDVRRNIVGIRPGRNGGYRLERSGNVIHAYGFAGAGYRYSVGAAQIVVDMFKELEAPMAKL